MLPEAMALTLATEPFDATAVATRPGTPHEPPSAQLRDPGGLEIALAIRPPIGKYVPAVPPVPMRKKVMSWAAASRPPNAVPRPPSSAALRLMFMHASLTRGDLTASFAEPQRRLSIDPDSSAHGRPNLVMDHHVGVAVLVGRVAVDDHQPGALALGDAREARRRIDHQRAAQHDEEVARHGLVLRPRHGDLGHRLAERDRGGLHDAVAFHAERQLAVAEEALPDRLELVTMAAVQAACVGGVAVQLDHLGIGHARALVQAV